MTEQLTGQVFQQTSKFKENSMPLGAFRINSLSRYIATGGDVPSRLPKTINLYGDANYTTSQQKIGAGSLSLDGSGDYIDLSYSEDIGKWNQATGYTLEYWVKLNSLSGTSYPDGATHELPTGYGNHGATNNVNYWSFGPVDNGNVVFFYYNGGKVTTQTSGVTLSTGTWYHLAFVYDGSSGFKIFIDGTERASASVSGSPAFSGSYPVTLGAAGSTTQYMNAYIDELRVSTVARYTTSFTPSTTAFENDEDTVLLVHADSDVTDDGNFTVQATGGTTSLETIDSTDYVVHTFTSSDTFTPLASMNIDALIIGGGGGGGKSGNTNGSGGGGGAGGVLEQSSISVSATGYTITIGAGGGAQTAGSTTSAFGYTVSGGAAGGGHLSNGSSSSGTYLGSGGGSGSTSGSTRTGGSGAYNGGSTTQTYGQGAGGGGSAANGSNSSNFSAGAGGTGIQITTFATSNFYIAGGGGGGGGANGSGAPGASGGDGGGAAGGGDYVYGSHATANTGSGGGGGGNYRRGGNGGSGVVKIRYPA